MNVSGFKYRGDMQSKRQWNNKSIQEKKEDCEQCKQIDVSSQTKWRGNFQKIRQ